MPAQKSHSGLNCVVPRAANENVEYNVDRRAVDAIGQRLRAAFAPIVNADVPDDILALVESMMSQRDAR